MISMACASLILLSGFPIRNLFGRVHLNENVSMPQPGSYKFSSECLASKLLVFRGDHWHRHRGRRRRGMYFSEADVTDLHKP